MAKNILKDSLKNTLKKRGFYQDMLKERSLLEAENQALSADVKKYKKQAKANKEVLEYSWHVPPGHFYSPLLADMTKEKGRLLDLEDPKMKERIIPGIPLDSSKQLAFLKKIAANLHTMPDFSKEGTNRYFYHNGQFGRADGTFLYLMLKHFKPKRLVEVGSGWSSALMLDAYEQNPKDDAELTFIDPYPDRLHKAIREQDKKRSKIIAKKVQDVDPIIFKQLESSDILFIDNSHVSKSGSDVNYLLHEIVPKLKKGVIIHIHDIFYPFEYPKQWLIDDHRNWNEAYMVRALLTDSKTLEIKLWHSFLQLTAKEKLHKIIPPGGYIGASLWVEKVN